MPIRTLKTFLHLFVRQLHPLLSQSEAAASTAQAIGSESQRSCSLSAQTAQTAQTAARGAGSPEKLQKRLLTCRYLTR